MPAEKTMEVKIHEIFEIRIHGNSLAGPVACLEAMPDCVLLLSTSQTKGTDSSKGSTTFAFKFLPLYPADTHIKFRLAAGDGREQEIIYHLVVKGLKDVKVWKVRPIRKS
jgi:aspartate oxidase